MKTWLLSAAVASLAFGSQAVAQENLKIGVLYALSGPNAQLGVDSLAALKTVVDIVNEGADLPLPLAKGGGLPGLKGGKIELVVADHQGKPDVGQSEAERLIAQEKVNVLLGGIMSSVSAPISQVSERAAVPFVNGSSSAPSLTNRGFQYFFRTTPHDEHFVRFQFDFLKDFEKLYGKKIETVAILNEDSALGSDSARVQNRVAKERGVKVLESISYKVQTPSLTSEVQRLKAANADVVLQTGFTADSILLYKTAKDLDYNPPLVIAQGAGFVDPSFLKTLGRDAEGAITRSPFNGDLAQRFPLIAKVQELFKKHSNGRELTDIPAREFTSIYVLLDAVNRAGSVEPEKIRAALAATDLPSDQLVVPYEGVKFDQTGQNVKARSIMIQVQNGKYCTFYPAELAVCKLVYPAPNWAQKAAQDAKL
ncbi:ABC transporter substrate-binding protein [Methylopila musalis]|uniref:ABC transporter substrate-binding protein n=1 Tax=Methylopila musalis TaxID=1134781 RepID=A0ABW3Z350_9HYPH